MGDNMGGHSLKDVKKVCHRNLSLVVYKGKIWYLENLLTILRPLTEKYPFNEESIFISNSLPWSTFGRTSFWIFMDRIGCLEDYWCPFWYVGTYWEGCRTEIWETYPKTSSKEASFAQKSYGMTKFWFDTIYSYIPFPGLVCITNELLSTKVKYRKHMVKLFPNFSFFSQIYP